MHGWRAGSLPSDFMALLRPEHANRVTAAVPDCWWPAASPCSPRLPCLLARANIHLHVLRGIQASPRKVGLAACHIYPEKIPFPPSPPFPFPR